MRVGTFGFDFSRYAAKLAERELAARKDMATSVSGVKGVVGAKRRETSVEDDIKKARVRWTGAVRLVLGFSEFARRFMVAEAARVVAAAARRTPVVTGRLSKAWSIGGTHRAGFKYETDILNSVEYASAVEYGARKRDGRWRNGRFMLANAIEEEARLCKRRFDAEFKRYSG
ncbi:MAG: HK97 gp10 family phage protein [Clostridiales bacterium]|jgi:hypothetical protein|nr:HK97 gp10 family phage protein [Clostridiales bacterium]